MENSAQILEEPKETINNNNSNNHKKLNNNNQRKLTLLPLIFLIHFQASGGPFGEEPAVKAAGPLFAILGFLIFPFIWSIPQALLTAELATAFPGNGGYIIWASHAFGPFWGFLMGSWKFSSGVINNASYPILCIDYLKLLFPVFTSGLPRFLAISSATFILSFLNYTSLTIFGYTTVALGTISLMPFLVMAVASIPKIKPHRWISLGQPGMKRDWNVYFNTLFWNLNYWDNVSIIAGEVVQPQKTFPKALLSAGILTCLAYVISLMSTIGSLESNQESWDNGFLAEAAGLIVGKWLKIWIEIGVVVSAIGVFEAQLSTSSFQLLGMADTGFLPRCFQLRSKWFDTPWVGILVSSLMTYAVSFLGFTNIISVANFLYGLGMLLEFSSFIWLRWKHPLLMRPFKVPMGLIGSVVMCLVPTGILIYVMAIVSEVVYLVCASLTLAGIVGYFLMSFCKSKRWLEFNKIEDETHEQIESTSEDEGTVLVSW
ncbi:probable polyamine transporter At3g13620 [Telopea speciosissima]|uniref:probable polyamine transporter At3g13620 n=1 Tax=Telopea speciosissima TaxID=54955 RepID=UPI001CC7A062|nr:probable polyamine transporter At3g13620 [Telopea speciosissima]